MFKRVLLCASALAACPAVSDTQADNPRVADSDTLRLNGAQFHRLETDMTKLKQVCGQPQVKWYCDAKTKRTLKLMVNGGSARCEYVLGLVLTECAKSQSF